jgi:hypothetical protein
MRLGYWLAVEGKKMWRINTGWNHHHCFCLWWLFKHKLKMSHLPIKCNVIFNSSFQSIEIFLNLYSVIKKSLLFLQIHVFLDFRSNLSVSLYMSFKKKTVQQNKARLRNVRVHPLRLPFRGTCIYFTVLQGSNVFSN